MRQSYVKATVKLKKSRRQSSPTQVTYQRLRIKVLPVLKRGVTLRNKVVNGWSDQDKPTFVPLIEIDGTLIRMSIKVEAQAAPSADVSVWRLLNDGTDVKRVILSTPYQRKTKPGQFGSLPGKGHVVKISPNISLPGIPVGHWDEDANAIMQPEIERAIENAIIGR